MTAVSRPSARSRAYGAIAFLAPRQRRGVLAQVLDLQRLELDPERRNRNLDGRNVEGHAAEQLVQLELHDERQVEAEGVGVVQRRQIEAVVARVETQLDAR